MNITSKSRYAMKIMMDLAYHDDGVLVNREDLSRRQGVPVEYLDQILIRLRKAELVESVKGRSGGYRLARDPSAISAWDIFSSVEDNFYPVACVVDQHSCAYDVSCVSKDAWSVLFEDLKRSLLKFNLESLVRSLAKDHHMCAMGGIKECRPG